MFPELTRLKHLIVNPPANALSNKAEWTRLTRLIPCTFVLSEEQVSSWANRGMSVDNWIAPVQRIPQVSANIEHVLARYDLEPHEVAYVTSDAREIRAAAHARTGTVLLGEDFDGVWPDLRAYNVANLITQVKSYLDGQAMGYFGEVTTTLNSRGQRAGKAGYLKELQLSPSLPGPVRFFALGRYFPKEDALHYKHQYTQRILTTKKRVDQPLGEMLARVLEHVGTDVGRIDFVTVVPPKPSNSSIGLRSTVELGASKAELEFRPDALRCPQDFPRQRGVPFARRAENVSGKFQCGDVPRVEHVVLVDDIVTTGSTVAECARVLLEQGIGRVTVLAFGATQESARFDRAFVCPKCGKTMVCRFSPRNHLPFFGCTGYPKCEFTMPWDEGIVRWNQLNTLGDLHTSRDIPF